MTEVVDNPGVKDTAVDQAALRAALGCLLCKDVFRFPVTVVRHIIQYPTYHDLQLASRYAAGRRQCQRFNAVPCLRSYHVMRGRRAPPTRASPSCLPRPITLAQFVRRGTRRWRWGGGAGAARREGPFASRHPARLLLTGGARCGRVTSSNLSAELPPPPPPRPRPARFRIVEDR